MRNKSYLPTTDTGILNWSANFSDQINLGPDQPPEEYGLTLAQAQEYQTLQQSYATAYQKAKHPDTRGGSTIKAKNLAKKALIAESRKLAMIVTYHPGVTDQMRYDLGLTVRDTEPTPVPPPGVPPVVSVEAIYGRTFTIRLRDATSTSRGKPEGVQGAQLFTFVGEQPPQTLGDWTSEGNQTRTRLELTMPESVAPGSKVWLSAYWYNRTGQSGPASTPVDAHVGYGGVAKEAA